MKDLILYYIGIALLLNVLSVIQIQNHNDNTTKIIQTLKAMQVYSVNK